MISGNQIETEVKNLVDTIDPKYRENIEIALIATSENRIKNGLAYYKDEYAQYDEGSITPDFVVPIKAYYKIPTRAVTGFHSASDLCFETPISRIVTDLNNKSNISRSAWEPEYKMPSLTNIERPYRSMKPKRLRYLS